MIRKANSSDLNRLLQITRSCAKLMESKNIFQWNDSYPSLSAFENDVNNNFVPSNPTIGFSDDDIRNVEVMKKHFKDKPDNIVKTYSTAGGIKKEY